MLLTKPTPEDIRKLHLEVNQIVNQRFLLTTAAITIFGTGVALILPKESTSKGSTIDDLIEIRLFMSGIFSLLLVMLYFHGHKAEQMHRIITSYLIETGESKWEIAWKKYNLKRDYTYSHTIIFLLLNFVNFACIFVVIKTYYNLQIIETYYKLQSEQGYLLYNAFWIITEILIVWMGFHDRFKFGQTAAERWRILNTL